MFPPPHTPKLEKVKVTQSCLLLCNPMDYSLPSSSVHVDSPGKTPGVGCHALFQGIFPTQGSNPGLSHCRQILYHLSHQGSPPQLLGSPYLPQLEKALVQQGRPSTAKNKYINCCSVAHSCPTLCDLMDCSTPGFPVLHHLPVFAQTHIH